MKILREGRITPQELKRSGVKHILDKMRSIKGYYLTNTERDLSQSDFKNRIMPHTQILVAPERNDAGYFSLEITGGASVHVDMLRKQMNPLEKLDVLEQLHARYHVSDAVPRRQSFRLPSLS